MTPLVSYDYRSKAVYILMGNENPVAETRCLRETGVLVTMDVDHQGELVGFEIIFLNDVEAWVQEEK